MVTDPNLGRLVDSRYEIVDRVARGGMATVYRAHDRRLDRVVALKLMHPHLADSPDFVARFRREARAAARLSSPGVVAVYDQGSLDGIAYLVMELVEGPTLRDLIATGPLSVRESLGLTAQVLGPLGAAHRADLVHRDVKPENVLLPADGSVAKVADFGLARAVTEATQTSTGNVLGTVAYLAPELITHGASGPRADVFSVGVILYELLTGEQPFSAEAPIQIAFRNVHDDVPPPSALVPELAPQVDELVRAMTERDPDHRLADADAALAWLRSTVAVLTPAEMHVRRGGGTGNARTQEALIANAASARAALRDDAAGEDPDATPAAGTRTVSLPVGTFSTPTGSSSAASSGGAGPNATTRVPGAQRGAASPVRTTDPQATTAVPTRRHGAGRHPRRRAVIAAGAIALLGAGGASAWYLTEGPGRRVAVPDVAGRSEDEARTAVEAAGLTWGSPSQSYSDTVPADTVISTEPSASDRLRVTGTVTAVVSLGVEQKTVPDVVGMTQEAATSALEGAGLALGAVTSAWSSKVPEGEVISSDPVSGTALDHGSAVALEVSKGREPATVPDVVGMTQDEAESAVAAAGLALGDVTQEFSDDVARGSVISSDPASGADGVHVGDSMALVVSKGPEMVTVPDVTGKQESEARRTLEDLGLTVTVSDVMGGLFGTAHSTDPAAGKKVRAGSEVTLYIV
ncbi:serine/threonine protein kinase [Actinomyces radicidentis]|uniref:non-specific serine/threonine protein kinase n=1 Tax=Actinomyces radicidentis TaxID=111015 RepID=A0A0X8JGQ7_ACTRD|nr:Stk1 family PASTA domain-containing Ser/Thr kinase [Actinomyces radicidentis]AMD88093.1 serine/threonine protein kinase [Actinomyces radicidentis]